MKRKIDIFLIGVGESLDDVFLEGTTVWVLFISLLRSLCPLVLLLPGVKVNCRPFLPDEGGFKLIYSIY